MPFMVIYRTSDGGSCFEQADAIDQAALFVERLRNQESIDQIRIYRMEEISFAFRPYYKVELGLPERQAVGPRPEPAPMEETPLDVAVPDTEDVEPELDLADAAVVEPEALPPLPQRVTASTDDGDAASANGRRGLFGR